MKVFGLQARFASAASLAVRAEVAGGGDVAAARRDALARRRGARDRGLTADAAAKAVGVSKRTLAGLSERLARNEERMNTHQATQESAFDRLRADMAKWDADMVKRDAEMAKRDAEMAKRDKDNTRWLIGMWVAAVIVLGTFLSTLITWPP